MSDNIGGVNSNQY